MKRLLPELCAAIGIAFVSSSGAAWSAERETPMRLGTPFVADSTKSNFRDGERSEIFPVGNPYVTAEYTFRGRQGLPIWIEARVTKASTCNILDSTTNDRVCGGYLSFRLFNGEGREVCNASAAGAYVLGRPAQRIGECLLPADGSYKLEVVSLRQQISEYLVNSGDVIPVRTISLGETITDRFTGLEQKLPFEKSGDGGLIKLYFVELPEDTCFQVSHTLPNVAANVYVRGVQGDYLSRDEGCKQYRSNIGGIYQILMAASSATNQYRLTVSRNSLASTTLGAGNVLSPDRIRELVQAKLSTEMTILDVKLHNDQEHYLVSITRGRLNIHSRIDKLRVDARTGRIVGRDAAR